MIKNIQKYILLHHPMLWNIRLVPMLIILFAANLIFFAIGYLTIDVSFDKAYYSSPMSDLRLMYFFAILVAVLIFIGWMFFYSRNNALKTFYPRRPLQVYFEWLIILGLIAGITILPFSLTMGGIVRWQAISTKNEAQQIVDLSNQIKLLLPNDRDNYGFDADHFKPIAIADADQINIQELNLDNYSLEYTTNNQIILKGFIGNSLLFYKAYYNGYNLGFEENDDLVDLERKYNPIDSDVLHTRKNVMQLKNWLRTGQKDSILNLMDTYIKLLDKHQLKHPINKNQWFDRIYNPPYFEVNINNYIFDSNRDKYNTDYYIDGDYNETSRTIPYLQMQELKAVYENVLEAYNYHEEIETVLLICICFAIAISILVFSFRITNGRSWLANFLLTGILLFLFILFAVIIGINGKDEVAGIIFIFLWLALFVVAAIAIIGKAYTGRTKGRSNIYFNFVIWMIPCLLPLMFCEIFLFLDLAYNNMLDQDYIIYNMFVINILVVIGLMLPISFLVHKWKSIPEE